MLKFLNNLFHKPQPPQRPQIIFPFDGEVESSTRRKLINWLQSPETRLAMQMIERARPTVWVSNNQEATKSTAPASGWEAYKNAMLSLGEEPQTIKAVEENFPTDTEL